MRRLPKDICFQLVDRLANPLLYVEGAEVRIGTSRAPERFHSVTSPSFIEPMSPTLVEAPPEGEGWIHEIKHDGHRTQLVIDENGVRAFTRNGFDWSDRYPAALAAAGDLGCSSAIIDGEMILQDVERRSDFEGFRRAMTERPDWLVFMAFDLLH